MPDSIFIPRGSFRLFFADIRHSSKRSWRQLMKAANSSLLPSATLSVFLGSFYAHSNVMQFPENLSQNRIIVSKSMIMILWLGCALAHPPFFPHLTYIFQTVVVISGISDDTFSSSLQQLNRVENDWNPKISDWTFNTNGEGTQSNDICYFYLGICSACESERTARELSESFRLLTG